MHIHEIHYGKWEVRIILFYFAFPREKNLTNLWFIVSDGDDDDDDGVTCFIYFFAFL